MATYEKVTVVTGSFEVVDAKDHEDRVTEYTIYFVRLSTTKSYKPMLGGILYRLEDGTGVRRTCGGHFDSEDGAVRFFVVREHDRQMPQGLANVQCAVPMRAHLH